jgi:branched-chain amino acid transport system permease protein
MSVVAVVPREARRRLAATVALLTIAAAASVAVPILWDSPYWISVGANIATFAVFGISYNILLGSAGIFSFGHALFFGVSGYVLANLMLRTNLDFMLGAALAIAATAFLAASVGVFTARLSGISLSIVTLAVAEAFFTAAGQDVGGLTQGEDGLYLERIPEFLNINLHADNVYWLSLGVLAVVLVIVAFLRRSPMGKNWQGMRENRLRAEALGVNVRAQQVAVMTVAGAIAGAAGVLNVLYVQAAAPDSLHLNVTVQAILITIIGGPGSFWGPIAGAIFVRGSAPLLDEFGQTSFVLNLSDIPQRALTSHPLILGVIYVILVMFLPGGIASIRQAIRSRRRVVLGRTE